MLDAANAAFAAEFQVARGNSPEDRLQASVAVAAEYATWLEALDELGRAISTFASEFPGLSGAQRADMLEFSADFATRFYGFLYGESHLVGEEDLSDSLSVQIALGFLDLQTLPGGDEDSLREPFERVQVRFDRLAGALLSPTRYLREAFGWGSELEVARLLSLVATGLERGLGTRALLLETPGEPTALEAFRFRLSEEPALVPPGISLTSRAETRFAVDRTLSTDRWDLSGVAALRLPADTELLLQPPFSVRLGPGQEATKVALHASARRRPGSPATLLGEANSFGLLLDAAAFELDVEQELDESVSRPLSIGASASLEGLRLNRPPPGEDGLLASLVPDGLSPVFNLSAGWSLQDGLSFGAGGGLEMAVPVAFSLGEAVNIDQVRVSLEAALGTRVATKLAFAVAARVAATLGPAALSLNRVGLQAVLGFPTDSGNLGPLDFNVAPTGPTQIGIQIDAGAVVGGGAIELDETNDRFAGALQLRVLEVGVSAFAVLDRRLPSGEQGYSLAALISGTFTPIQLGLGFTLNGIGGALGINRTVNSEALETAVRAGGLEHLLFSDSPGTQAAEVLRDLQAFFPPSEGRYTFGPLAKIGWGTPSLIEADVGLVLELPSPVRLTLLGTIRAGLPSAEKRFVKLTMAILGQLDSSQKRLSLDATLYDSSVGGFPVSGDMAFRLSWGDSPSFAMSIGGFHPAFAPPSSFPEMRRVTLEISRGGNPSLTCSGYLALTSNTAQVGALAEIRAGKKWNIYGWIGFDSLFTFSPFSFEANINAGVALRRGSKKKASVTLRGTLSGPNPWFVRGKACVSLWFLKVCVGFEKTLSKKQPEPLPSPPDLLEAVLVPAVSEPGRWSATGPPDAFVGASLGGGQAPTYLTPNGAVTLRQTELPLGEKISRYGGQTLPASQRATYRIEQVRWLDAQGADQTATFSSVHEPFARGQFQSLSDSEALSAPAFESMVAGATVDANAVRVGRAETTELGVETYVINDLEQDDEERNDGYRMSMDALRNLAKQSAPAIRGVRASGTGAFRLGFGPVESQVALSPRGYSVVSQIDHSGFGDAELRNELRLAREELGVVPKGRALALVQAAIQRRPDLAPFYQVLAEDDVETTNGSDAELP